MNVNDELCEVVGTSLEKLAFLFSSPDPFSHPLVFEDSIVSGVTFSGDFSGRLIIAMDESALTELAANMLGVDSDEVDEDERKDALKEAANIICGNWLPIKAGDAAVFNISSPFILSTQEAEKCLSDREPTDSCRLSVEEGRCDVYCYQD